MENSRTESITIRPIQPADNPVIAEIIRSSLAEFGANKPGTVYFDDSTDHLFELFRKEGSAYLIAEKEGEIAGGAGIYPSNGLPAGTCELVKMYLLPQFRGIGLGRRLISQALDLARDMGYHSVYLETMPELKQAVKVYEKFGFTYLTGPMGDTGHFGCDVWMVKGI